MPRHTPPLLLALAASASASTFNPTYPSSLPNLRSRTHNDAVPSRVTPSSSTSAASAASAVAVAATASPVGGCYPAAVQRLRGGGNFGASLTSATRLLFADAGLLRRKEMPQGIQKHMRGVVFGGLDGILTTFALLAAVVGSAQASHSLTLVIGISTVLADALSMGAGEYLSAKAEHELVTPDSHEPGPFEKGIAMFLAFTIFGSLPLIGYIISAAVSHHTGIVAGGDDYFRLSIGITAVTLFMLGTIKSTFGSGSWWKSGLEVSAIGGTAACVAYFTAHFVEKLVEG